VIQSKTQHYIKLDKRNHVEKNLLSHLDRLGRGIIALIKDLLTGEKPVTALLENIP